jgi:hypothetical protein
MSRRTKLIAGLLLVLLIAAGAGFLYWRYWPVETPASQRGRVEQQIARTTVSVEYHRPSAGGREPFGDIVAWGQMWNPGADRQAVIAFSRDVEVNGQPVASGRYAIWAQPQDDAWTVILSRAIEDGVPMYREGQDAVRLSVSPRSGPFMETLAFYFPVVDGTAAELVLHWGRVVVPLQIGAR